MARLPRISFQRGSLGPSSRILVVFSFANLGPFDPLLIPIAGSPLMVKAIDFRVSSCTVVPYLFSSPHQAPIICSSPAATPPPPHVSIGPFPSPLLHWSTAEPIHMPSRTRVSRRFRQSSLSPWCAQTYNMSRAFRLQCNRFLSEFFRFRNVFPPKTARMMVFFPPFLPYILPANVAGSGSLNASDFSP